MVGQVECWLITVGSYNYSVSDEKESIAFGCYNV